MWPENWEAVKLFSRLTTQWKYGVMGHVLALDYLAVEAVMNMMQVPKRARLDLLDQIQVMEQAGVEWLNVE